jgi:hypothetical protein
MPHEIATGTIWVNGIFVPPIGVLPTVVAPNNIRPAHELFVGTEYAVGTTGTHKLYRVRRFEGVYGDTFDLLGTHTYTTGTADTTKPVGMQFGSTRSNSADNTVTGVPITVALWVHGVNTCYVLSFPDDAAPSTNTPYYHLDNSGFPLAVACHQGRTVLQHATAYGQGVNASTFMGEDLDWSRVNNFKNWAPNTDPAIAIHVFPQCFVPENPSGYAFLAPMTANELFAVKGTGALYVSGDLDNPTVVTLPMATGSDLSHTPAFTDIGVVYGNRVSGIWAWSHGDNSSLVSPTMTPDFWVLTPGVGDDAFGGIAYQFGRCDDWVLVPNNFLYDVALKSWWRLEDPSVAQMRFYTCMGHLIYGAESSYTAAADKPVHLWQRDVKGPSYSWQSQPIWQSVADVVNVAEIELVARGHGQVKLSLTALDGTTNSITIELADAGYPERFRENFAIQGKYLQLRIEADSFTPLYYPAPTVYSVTLYPFTEQPIGHTL